MRERDWVHHFGWALSFIVGLTNPNPGHQGHRHGLQWKSVRLAAAEQRHVTEADKGRLAGSGVGMAKVSCEKYQCHTWACAGRGLVFDGPS